MRVSIAEAMHASRNAAKRTRKAEVEATNPPAVNTSASKSPSRKTEFERRPSTTRLNDVAQAPPNLTRVPRGASRSKEQTGVMGGKVDGVISMAQRQLMEEDRATAIKRYRQLKEARNAGWADLR